MRSFPFIVAALCLSLASPGAASAQSAQPASAEPAFNDDVAKKHYEDGRAAAEKGNWEAAYTSFRAALAVEESYLILGALGDAAHHLGKYRDAAENLVLYLQKAPATLPAAERAAAEKTLADARQRVGTLTITAPAGAEVFVDSVIVGKAPLGREVFVEPGTRDVEARSEKDSVKLTATVEKGKSAAVSLVFGAAPPASTGPAKPLEKPLPTAPLAPTVAPPSGPQRDILVAGVAAAAGAAAVGAVLLGASRAKASEEEALRSELVKLKLRGVCTNDTPDARCNRVKDTAAAVDGLTNAGAWLLIGAGAAGITTLIYYLATGKPAEPRAAASAVIAPHHAGGSLSLRW